MSALETFIKRYDNAKRGNAKELRLQMHEAEDLAHEVSLMGIQNSELAQQLIDLQAKIIKILENKNSSDDITIEMDGGGFK